MEGDIWIVPMRANGSALDILLFPCENSETEF